LLRAEELTPVTKAIKKSVTAEQHGKRPNQHIKRTA
jgi:hypothetical protein